jgi:hypothetical protein
MDDLLSRCGGRSANPARTSAAGAAAFPGHHGLAAALESYTSGRVAWTVMRYAEAT